MGSQTQDARGAAAWELARTQHGVLTRSDLLGLGFSPESIKHRIARGRLHCVARGIYAVGRPQLTQEGRWMAAVLACGAGAALSHRSAGALWGVEEERGSRIDVLIRRKSSLRRPGIRLHIRPHLLAASVTRRRGIPVTAPVQTLIDLAIELSPRQLERAVNEADKRDLVDPESLRAALGAYVGQPGVRALRTLLDCHTFRLSDTELEVLFRPLATAAGLPMPLTKQMVNGFEVDFYWPGLGLVVETDGLRYHRTATTQSRDALRDQTHTASGLTPLRFSHRQVKYESDHVRQILARTARNLERG
jgi:very-short-patch-repair endonuclease